MARWRFPLQPAETQIECVLETTELKVGLEATFTISLTNPTATAKTTNLTVEVIDGFEKTLLADNEETSIDPGETIEKQYTYTPETENIAVNVIAPGL